MFLEHMEHMKHMDDIKYNTYNLYSPSKPISPDLTTDHCPLATALPARTLGAAAEDTPTPSSCIGDTASHFATARAQITFSCDATTCAQATTWRPLWRDFPHHAFTCRCTYRRARTPASVGSPGCRSRPASVHFPHRRDPRARSRTPACQAGRSSRMWFVMSLLPSRESV